MGDQSSNRCPPVSVASAGSVPRERGVASYCVRSWHTSSLDLVLVEQYARK